VALALARAGARVLVTGRHADTLAEVAAVARARGVSLATVRSDASSVKQVGALFRRAAATIGGPDLLVHAAGDYWEGPVSRLTGARWEELARSNVTSAIHTIQAALPGMRRRRHGRILLFGVAGGDSPRSASRAHAYRAVKVALLTLARSIAHEEAANGITVNMILPGIIRTQSTPARDAKRARLVPARRLGTPSEIARAALFLLADESGYITGSTLTLSGGYLI
jgi:NAD(P)-dependent dehydrogenase (short-subunit alcohol dehydrogenase family)